MRLPDLIDIETQLAQDTGAVPAELRAREKKIRRQLDGVKHTPEGLLTSWIRAVRKNDTSGLFPGELTLRALRWLRLSLTLLGLFMGWGLAETVLVYDGSHPVNVLHFLTVFVGMQLLLLLVLLLPSVIAPRLISRLPLVHELHALLRFVLHWILRRAAVSSSHIDAWQSTWQRLATRRTLYQSIEPWLLLETTQYFAVAFNIGALIACLRLIAFSDLAFAWSTTLQSLDAQSLHRLISALATPWSWALDDALPSLQLIEQTQYARLDSAYIAAAGERVIDVTRVGAWWSFLVMAQVTYGLLPRLLVLVIAKLSRRWTLAHLRLDDVDIQRLLRRLQQPTVETSARDDAHEAEALDTENLATADRLTTQDRLCQLIYWRDFPHVAQLVPTLHSQLGLQIEGEFDVNGTDIEQEKRVCDALASGRKRNNSVVVVAEAWEAPDKATLRFLRLLRQGMDDRETLIVVLAVVVSNLELHAPAAEDVLTWHDRLESLRDPYLALEVLERP